MVHFQSALLPKIYYFLLLPAVDHYTYKLLQIHLFLEHFRLFKLIIWKKAEKWHKMLSKLTSLTAELEGELYNENSNEPRT